MNSLKIYCVTNKRLIQLEKSVLNFAGVGNDKFPNNYIKPDMTISAHKDDQEWYPPTIDGMPIFASITFYPNGKPIAEPVIQEYCKSLWGIIC